MPTGDVLQEIDRYLSNRPYLDHITFSGSGEPTLHKDISKIIEHIKINYPRYRLALLTNGSLFHRKEVRKDVLQCDIIIPSLDATEQADFIKINRPHKKINLGNYINGLAKLKKEFQGQYILEIFLAKGINDSKSSMRALADAVAKIKPDAVQINTLHRPGAVNNIKPADVPSMKTLQKLIKALNIKTEIIPSSPRLKQPDIIQHKYNDIYEKILSALSRRPMTAKDLSGVFGLRKTEVNKYLNILEKAKKIKVKIENNSEFFLPYSR